MPDLDQLVWASQAAHMPIRIPSQCHEVIEQQRGVIARWQASSCALDLSAIDALLRQGRWHTLYRGVYATYQGNSPRTSLLWAAVRRCGPEAALSHFTAAELDRITDDPSEVIHVTVPRDRRVLISAPEFSSGLPRIALHRSSRISSARHPARTPPRTRIEEIVLDLTDLAQGFDLAFSWLSAACARRLVTPEQIRAAAARRARLRWRAAVLGALEEISAGVFSNLERHYLRDVERPHRLPEAKRQARMKRGTGSAYLDNLYAEFTLAVELDGLAAHPAEARWDDIHRDNYFASSGIVTLRYNWADVTTRPCQVAAEIAMALRQRGWTGTLRRCRACPQAPCR